MGNGDSKETEKQQLRKEISEEFKREQDKQRAEIEKREQEKQIEESLLEKPWRRFESDGYWSEKYRRELVANVRRHKAHKNMDSARILFIGPIQAGKSSFLNSVASIDQNRISCPFLVGSGAVSFSTKLKQYIPKGELRNFILLDTMGLEPNKQEGLIVQNFVYLINGNVLPNFPFNTRQPIDPENDQYFIKDPTLDEKPHCTVIVLDSCVMYSQRIPDFMRDKINELQGNLRTSDINEVIILTKIDKLCPHVKQDVRHVIHSRKVQKVVDYTSELFGVPPMNIFPVKNYSEEVELNQDMDILILLALRRMMHVASDRLINMEDQITKRSKPRTEQEPSYKK